jgi:hypothetical protein
MRAILSPASARARLPIHTPLLVTPSKDIGYKRARIPKNIFGWMFFIVLGKSFLGRWSQQDGATPFAAGLAVLGAWSFD